MGSTLDRSAVYFRADILSRDIQRQATIHIHRDNIDTQINQHVFGLWEAAGVPGGNPHRHKGNMQTPHRKATVGSFKHANPNQQPSHYNKH